MTALRRTRRTAALVAGAGAGLALLAAPALAATSTPAPTTTPTVPAATATEQACDAGPWGARVQGVPPYFAAGSLGGDYLWHDKTGFHLRITHGTDKRAIFTGAIVSNTAMQMDPVLLEKGDVAKLSPDHRVLYFAFSNYGHVDGVNFHTDCATAISVRYLNVGNQHLPAKRVFLGAHELHPAAVPFAIHRTDKS